LDGQIQAAQEELGKTLQDTTIQVVDPGANINQVDATNALNEIAATATEIKDNPVVLDTVTTHLNEVSNRIDAASPLKIQIDKLRDRINIR